MIYTIGTKATYYPLIEQGDVLKNGATDEYQGGTVWKTYAAARGFLDEYDPKGEYDVFGVLADWDIETRPSTDGGEYHDLLVDAKIVDLRGLDNGG